MNVKIWSHRGLVTWHRPLPLCGLLNSIPTIPVAQLVQRDARLLRVTALSVTVEGVSGRDRAQHQSDVPDEAPDVCDMQQQDGRGRAYRRAGTQGRGAGVSNAVAVDFCSFLSQPPRTGN